MDEQLRSALARIAEALPRARRDEELRVALLKAARELGHLRGVLAVREAQKKRPEATA